MKRSSVCSLDEALRYRNDEVVERFTANYNVSNQDAERIFLEAKKWVWLLAKANEDRRNGLSVPRLVIDNYLIFIDEMWHNFILFTKEYQEYCHDKFGFFVHHNPTPQKTKQALREELKTDAGFGKTLDIRREQYSYIYDHLGGETLLLWYDKLSDQYPPHFFLNHANLGQK
jgi:hypothetical protein